jgi:serine/threonine protein kinase
MSARERSRDGEPSLVDPEDEARVGAVLQEKYRLDRLLGSGGMGAVYEATNGWTGRRVAIKVLRGHYAKHSAILERFIQEARTATALAHPNIVEVLDICREPDGLLFIVQELLLGEDLRARLDARGRPLAVEEAVEIAVPVMGALVAVHQAGVVHRDIKPDNVFLVRDRGGAETPKLIDFGVSKINDPNYARAQTQHGVTVGTPDYMAPEQARGDTSVDARADVWSMGVVLFEMLSGRVPFEGPTTNVVLVAVMTQRAPSLAALAPWVPPALVRVVDRALEHDRARRWDSMQSMLAALILCVDEPSARASLLGRHRASLPAPGDDVLRLPPHGALVPAAAEARENTDDFDDEDPTRVASFSSDLLDQLPGAARPDRALDAHVTPPIPPSEATVASPSAGPSTPFSMPTGAYPAILSPPPHPPPHPASGAHPVASGASRGAGTSARLRVPSMLAGLLALSVVAFAIGWSATSAAPTRTPSVTAPVLPVALPSSPPVVGSSAPSVALPNGAPQPLGADAEAPSVAVPMQPPVEATRPIPTIPARPTAPRAGATPPRTGGPARPSRPSTGPRGLRPSQVYE